MPTATLADTKALDTQPKIEQGVEVRVSSLQSRKGGGGLGSRKEREQVQTKKTKTQAKRREGPQVEGSSKRLNTGLCRPCKSHKEKLLVKVLNQNFGNLLGK